MVRVTFLDSNEMSSEEFQGRLTGLIEELTAEGQRVLILAPDETTARNWDRMLWVAGPESFIPHSVTQVDWPEDEPVTIRIQTLPENPGETVCFCLTSTPPAELAAFPEVYELVDRTLPTGVAESRTRWAQWKAGAAEMVYKKDW